MGEVSTIGLDIAKSVFQVHGVDVDGAVVIRKRISRPKLLEFFAALPPCLIGIEACSTGHHWSRGLQALGHMIRLMPRSYVKAYVSAARTTPTTLPPSARRSLGGRVRRKPPLTLITADGQLLGAGSPL